MRVERWRVSVGVVLICLALASSGWSQPGASGGTPCELAADFCPERAGQQAHCVCEAAELTATWDDDDDDVVDVRWVFLLDDVGRPRMAELDDNNDGNTNRITIYEFEKSGNLGRMDTNWLPVRACYRPYRHCWLTHITGGIDGTVPAQVNYLYDELGRLESLSEDWRFDGEIDLILVYAFDADGNRIEEHWDEGGDGTFDGICTYAQPCPAPFEDCHHGEVCAPIE